jgi:hypothetical protein
MTVGTRPSVNRDNVVVRDAHVVQDDELIAHELHPSRRGEAVSLLRV